MYTLIATLGDSLLIHDPVAIPGGRRAVMAAARRAAGRGARFFRAGGDCGYRGPRGTAWIA